MPFIQPLFEGPIDIVGDVHGEIEALDCLLARLGYDIEGRHPEGRRLVFVGDLTDRGPDSPTVLQRVAAMVQAGRAQCIVGNHELNLMRDVPKHGNDWWTQPDVETRLPAVPVTPKLKTDMKAFLETLPLALERDDLRVVHACWNEQAIAELRALETEGLTVLDAYRRYADRQNAKWHSPEARQRLRELVRTADLRDRNHRPPFLPLLAEYDIDYQMGNPVTVVTSGEEAPTTTPFWAGGRWRMVERVKWWERYDDPQPVVIGHYWRRYSDTPTVYADKYGPDVFEGITPHHWMGRQRNVYCVDFSVGGRSEQRYHGEAEQICQLAALRVPEWTVVHDDGEFWEINAPGGGRMGSDPIQVPFKIPR